MMPSFWLSFGCEEIAAFCGGNLFWSEGSGDTCWSKPFVDDWEASLPFRLPTESPLWQRMLDFNRKVAGKAVSVGGTPEQIKAMHREVRPEKTQYWTSTRTVAEAEDLLAWFVRNT